MRNGGRQGPICRMNDAKNYQVELDLLLRDLEHKEKLLAQEREELIERTAQKCAPALSMTAAEARAWVTEQFEKRGL